MIDQDVGVVYGSVIAVLVIRGEALARLYSRAANPTLILMSAVPGNPNAREPSHMHTYKDTHIFAYARANRGKERRCEKN